MAGGSMDYQDKKYCLLDDKKLEAEKILYYRTVDSTSLAIHRNAALSENYYTVVAEEQNKGRGRRGRDWFSPPGCGLWFSILLKPSMLKPENAQAITLITGAVIANHLNEKYEISSTIKWPNDLILNGKKLGGILTEMKGYQTKIDYIVAGIGLNVNQKPADFPELLKPLATSLFIETGRLFDRTELLISIRKALLKAYEIFYRQGFAPFHNLWLELNETTGKIITLIWSGKSLTGKVIDLSENGSLVVEDEHGFIHNVNYGEIKN
ncbi:MAG: biotin--[acetyl-CoA-carboxylase] ligase [Bacillota bacterium]|nr:biotin--[acetyl-CoA-carboxylase] ligase [Bacillota bacterium]